MNKPTVKREIDKLPPGEWKSHLTDRLNTATTESELKSIQRDTHTAKGGATKGYSTKKGNVPDHQ